MSDDDTITAWEALYGTVPDRLPWNDAMEAMTCATTSHPRSSA